MLVVVPVEGIRAKIMLRKQSLVLTEQLDGGVPHMLKVSLTRLAVGVGGLALSVTAAAGVASAQPNIDAMVNSPCTYDQAIAAVNAENPTAAQYLMQSPPNLEFVRVFLSSSADQRVSLLNQIKNNPGIDEAMPVFTQMMTSCVNY